MRSLVMKWGVGILLVAAGVGAPRVALATVGLAEWRLPTPGGNLVSHEDPYEEEHGTCIRPAGEGEIVYVSHVRWWQFFAHDVVGGAEEGYFILHERTGRVERFPDRGSMQRRARRLALGKPLSKRMLPDDGWAAVWAKRMPPATPAEIAREERAEHELCAEIGSQLATRKSSSLDRDEFEIRCKERRAVPRR